MRIPESVHLLLGLAILCPLFAACGRIGGRFAVTEKGGAVGIGGGGEAGGGFASAGGAAGTGETNGPLAGSAGVTASGGLIGIGGIAGNGGLGGVTSTGGLPSAGGTVGGAIETAGAPGTSGGSASGGSSGTGGTSGTSGATTGGVGGTMSIGGLRSAGGAVGGAIEAGGAPGTVGTSASGGSSGAGGTTGIGGVTTGGHYIVSVDGLTVTDTSTGLIWQRDGSGPRAGCSGGTAQIDERDLTCNWAEAKAYCAGLTLDGPGWRLPTLGELVTLVDDTVISGATIDQTAFPNTPPWYFWTSSPYVSSPGVAWDVDFNTGASMILGVGSQEGVRCVR